MTAPNAGASSSPSSSAQLFERWRRHQDRQARDELIQRFLPLARKLARRYVQSSEPYEDLVQVASLGLVKAVERFDPDRGFAFSSFAVPTIVGELKRYFRDTAWALHVDRGAQERARKITDAQVRDVLARTLSMPPPPGRQHWTTRTMAASKPPRNRSASTRKPDANCAWSRA